jgi:hypothetical protein
MPLRAPGGDDDLEDDDREDDGNQVGLAVPAEGVEGARRSRGARLAAANLIFDRVLYELTAPASGEDRGPDAKERFVDESFPPRYRQLHDLEFQPKILATIATVPYELANPGPWRPACTADELVVYAILQQWQVLLDVTPRAMPPVKRRRRVYRPDFASALRNASHGVNCLSQCVQRVVGAGLDGARSTASAARSARGAGPRFAAPCPPSTARELGR